MVQGSLAFSLGLYRLLPKCVLLKSIVVISALPWIAQVMPVSTGRYLTKEYHQPLSTASLPAAGRVDGQWPHIWGWANQILVNNLRPRLKPQIWGQVAA
jgi:hypothetical protein